MDERNITGEEPVLTEQNMTEEEPVLTDQNMAEEEPVLTEQNMTEEESVQTERNMTEEEPLLTEQNITEEESVTAERIIANSQKSYEKQLKKKENHVEDSEEKYGEHRDADPDCLTNEMVMSEGSPRENSVEQETVQGERKRNIKQTEQDENLTRNHNDRCFQEEEDGRKNCGMGEGKVIIQIPNDEPGSYTAVQNRSENESAGTFIENTPPCLCDPCSFDNEYVPSSAFCIDCIEYLCKSCFRDHNKNKMTRGHRLLIEDDIPASKKPFEYMNSLVHCKNHPDKEIEYKCSDHNVYICSSCEGRSHRKCDNVTELQELIKIEEDHNVTGSLLQQIEDGIELVLGHNQCKVENMVSMQKDTKALPETLAEVKKLYDEYFDSFIEQTSQTAESLVRAQVTTSESAIEKGKLFIREQEKEKQVLKTAVKHGSLKQIYFVTHTMQETMSSLDERLRCGNRR